MHMLPAVPWQSSEYLLRGNDEVWHVTVQSNGLTPQQSSSAGHMFLSEPYFLMKTFLAHNQLDLSQQERGNDLAKMKWEVGSRAGTGMGFLDSRVVLCNCDEHSMDANPSY